MPSSGRPTKPARGVSGTVPKRTPSSRRAPIASATGGSVPTSTEPPGAASALTSEGFMPSRAAASALRTDVS